MRYTPCWKQIGITRERYNELLYFCRQYPTWIEAISTDIPIEKRLSAANKIAFVDECARSVANGEWYASLIENICYGKPFSHMDKTLMPTADSNTFFRIRREFFESLENLKEQIDSNAFITR